MSVPNYIRKIRVAHGVSVTDLAKALGVTPSAVSKWESGANEVSDDLKIALANYFKMPVSALFAFEHQPLADALRLVLDQMVALRNKVNHLDADVKQLQGQRVAS